MSQKMSATKQDKFIQEEIDRLFGLFKDLPEDKLKMASGLIERAAFMKITLELLEDDIKKKGPVIPFKNGKQKMTIENPAQKSYNTMINRYTTAYEKLLNLLPKAREENEFEDDGFDEFVGGRGD